MSIAKIRIAAKAALVTAALTVATVSAQADTPYVFVAIDTTRHGADVVNGRYEEAIAGIRKDGESNFTYGESTNLCIAYTKSGDTVSALESCDRAVDIARTSRGIKRSSSLESRFNMRHKDLDLVVALSNRGVAHAANGDLTLAMEDLREADALHPSLHALSKNMSILTEASTQ